MLGQLGLYRHAMLGLYRRAALGLYRHAVVGVKQGQYYLVWDPVTIL